MVKNWRLDNVRWPVWPISMSVDINCNVDKLQNGVLVERIEQEIENSLSLSRPIYHWSMVSNKKYFQYPFVFWMKHAPNYGKTVFSRRFKTFSPQCICLPVQKLSEHVRIRRRFTLISFFRTSLQKLHFSFRANFGVRFQNIPYTEPIL